MSTCPSVSDKASDRGNRLWHFITLVSLTSFRLLLRFLRLRKWEIILTENPASSCCRGDHLTAFTFYGHFWLSPSRIPVRTSQCDSAFFFFLWVHDSTYYFFGSSHKYKAGRNSSKPHPPPSPLYQVSSVFGSVPMGLKCHLSDRQTLKQVNHPKPKAERADQLRPLCTDSVFPAGWSGFSCDTDAVCVHLITYFTWAAIGKFGKTEEEYFRRCFLSFL